MSYKTILLHLRDIESSDQLLRFGCKVARRFNAHLIGLHVLPPLVLPPAIEVPYGAEILNSTRAVREKDVTRLKKKFESTIVNQPFVGEWRVVDSMNSAVSHIVSEQARNVDLTIVSQAGSSSPNSDDDTVEVTAFESGRPVLIVPTAGTFDGDCNNILIAWNGQKEAARAVFDALPILKLANKVHILSVQKKGKTDRAVDIPGAEIAAALARHGVRCETAQTVSAGITTGDTLLNFSAEQGINLIVMGCYGHSRLRELVFGGVTKNLLEHMTAPVLMSH